MLNWISIVSTIAFASLVPHSEAPHEVYVSLTQIEYNAEAHTLEVALKLFTDDTDRTVGRHFRENLNLGEPDEHRQADSLLMDYINEALKFSCDGTVQEMRYYGKEVAVEETWIYFDYPLNCPKGSNVEIDNRIFTEVFEAQVNIMKFSAEGAEDQSLQLGVETTSGTFQLP